MKETKLDTTARYKIRNWERFQHYNKPRPAWIKLHRALLDDHDFQSLSTRSRALLVMLWLIAAESENGTIPGPDAVAWRLRLPPKEIKHDIQLLTHYLESLYTDSRGVLASDREETERETETEREITPSKSPGKHSEKIAFAPRVYLTEKEHADLTEKHGKEAMVWMIEKLDAWKDGKGLNGKGRGSDAGKIRAWVVDAWQKHLITRPLVPQQEKPKTRAIPVGVAFNVRGEAFRDGVRCPEYDPN